MQVASFDGIGRAPAMIVAVALLSAFVFVSGLRAVAWVSIVKDGLMLLPPSPSASECRRSTSGGLVPCSLLWRAPGPPI
jgi:hypothetical protein